MFSQIVVFSLHEWENEPVMSTEGESPLPQSQHKHWLKMQGEFAPLPWNPTHWFCDGYWKKDKHKTTPSKGLHTTLHLSDYLVKTIVVGKHNVLY